MFKLNFLKKKKTISLVSLHEIAVSPEKDWPIITLVSLGVVGVSAALSFYLFISVMYQNTPPISSPAPTPENTVDMANLQSAVDFIQSRSAQ